MSSSFKACCFAGASGFAMLAWEAFDQVGTRAPLVAREVAIPVAQQAPPAAEPVVAAASQPPGVGTLGEGPGPFKRPSPARGGGGDEDVRSGAPVHTVGHGPSQGHVGGSRMAQPPLREAGPCETEVRVAALVHVRADPAQSMAVLRGGECAGGRTVRVGSRVGERRVVEIAPRALRLKHDDAVCWIGMFTPRAREKVAREHARSARASTTAPKSTARPPSRAELAAGIDRLGEFQYRITRDLLERVVAHPAQFIAAMRLQPVREGTHNIGMRLGKVPRGSLWSRLGLQAGDILRTLNGHAVADRKAMELAQATLPRAPRIRLALERGQRLLRFEYVLD